MDVSLDRSFWPTRCFRYLGDPQTHNVSQNHCFTLGLAEMAETVIPCLPVDYFGVEARGLLHLDAQGSASAVSNVISSQIEGDRPQPWLQLESTNSTSVVTTEGLVRPNERLLG